MKRIILTLTMLVALVATASAQAEIKFDKLIHNFGSFEESNPVQKATFTFTNVGNKPLIINQAIASCGCTILLTPRSLSLQARRDRLVLPITARACSLVISRRASPSVLTAM